MGSDHVPLWFTYPLWLPITLETKSSSSALLCPPAATPHPAALTSSAALVSSCLGPLNLRLKTLLNVCFQTRMAFSFSSKARPQRSLLQAALLIAPGTVLAPAGGIPISIPDHVSLTPPGWWLPWGQAGICQGAIYRPPP